MDERLGRLSFWLIFVGFNLTFFPMHISGLLGMPRRVYTYLPGLGWDLWNLLSTIGAVITIVGILAVVLNFVWSVRGGAPAGPDPWGAHDLEWATSSPPPHYDFLEIPTVRSTEPLWDQPELRDMGRRVHVLKRTLADGHDTLGTTVVDAVPEAVLAMPHPTYIPIVTALGTGVMFIGLLTMSYPVMGLGVVAFLAGLLGWVRPKAPA
jgi:cytochrome c oxidase subunit I+III